MSVMKCILGYFKKHILVLILVLLIIALVSALSVVPPLILRHIVDDILTTKEYDRLLFCAIYYAVCYIGIYLINFLKEVTLVVVSQGIGKNIRLNMLKKVNKMNYVTFSKYDSGNLEAYFSNDVDEINTLITSGVISMVIDSFKMIGIIISIFVFSPMFGLVTLAVVPIIVLFTMWIRKRMFKAQAKNRVLEGNVNNLVLENLDNIVTIKSFRAYDSVKEKYQNVLNNHFKTNQAANTYDALFSPTMQILKMTLITLVVVFQTGFPTLFGMSVGMMVSSIDLLTNLFSPIENIGMEIQTIQKSLAAISRINEFFKMPEDEPKNKTLKDSNNIVLEFKDVSYSYNGKKDVIKDFNLKLDSRTRLTLEGRSGSGKSTIFKLAYGLIKPTKGNVTINGIDTYLLSDESKRKLFGIVYQDYFFSGGSIKEEIAMLDDSIPDSRVYEVLHEVGLDRITDINQKLVVRDYSTGELSLFNIARAIIFDSKILFLDEMNAKIDQVTAKKIIKLFNDLSKDKMVLSINHYGDLLENSSVLNLEKL